MNSSNNTPAGIFHKVPYKWVPVLLLGFAAAILLVTWPWAKTFASGVLRHWDPPFHAWKLEYAARQLLAGRLLPFEGNTNMYYPYTGAFYFEALHWPQAVVAAALFGLTNAGPVLVYHIVLVFFWALSGVCLWMLLRALGVSAVSAVLGALFFTLMPYRISYQVEFNMQLCFAIPLFFFFLVRYFQRPCVGYACGMAIAWWLQATSELYQAVFLVLVLPFPILAMMSGRWSLVRSLKKFWLPMLAALMLSGVLAFVWLWPYTVMLQSQTLTRGLQEISQHVLEPLSYLLSHGHTGLFGTIKARRDEMSVYPTLLLIVLSAVYLAFRFKNDRRILVPRWYSTLRYGRALVLLLFLLITILLACSFIHPHVAHLYSLLPVLACALSIPLMFDRGRRGLPSGFMNGLFASALLAFFMSLGPRILSSISKFSCVNWIYIWQYDLFEFLHGFRVVSRFAFFVLLWMTLASAFGLDELFRWANSRGRRFMALAGVGVLLVIFAAECIPTSKRTILPLPCPIESAVLSGLDKRAEPYVLAIVPMGLRDWDSQHMLQVARSHRLSVYAWGGTYPPYTSEVLEALSVLHGNDIPKAAELLHQLWPDCLLLEDKAFSRSPSTNINYAKAFANVATVEDEDSRFVLMRLKPETHPEVELLKLIRHDYLVNNPQVAFSAVCAESEKQGVVWLDLNGCFVGKWEITNVPQTIRLVLPDSLFSRYSPNRLRFHSESTAGFFLRDFKMEPAGVGIPEADSDPDTFMPWQGQVHDLPATAFPLDAEYPGGFRIFSAEVLDNTVEVGGTIRMRYYVRLPRKLRSLTSLSLKTGITQNGRVIFESGESLNMYTDMSLFWTGRRNGMFVMEQVVTLPDLCVEGGEYGLAITIKNSQGERISGRSESGEKVKRLYLPLKFVVAEKTAVQ